jgi:hypothetical protein
MAEETSPKEIDQPELQPEASDTPERNVNTVRRKPPPNNFPPSEPRYLHNLKFAVIVSLCVLAVGGISYGIYVVNDAVTGISATCDQKVQSATRQAQQQTNELQGITLFGSGPKITRDLDDDCLDGTGMGSAMAAYQVNNVTLTQANNEALKVIGGTELPLTLSGNGDTNSQTYNDNENSGLINSLSTTITTPGNKTYDVQFLFTDVYDCPNVCDTGNDIVQTYNLQNESIREVDVEVN